MSNDPYTLDNYRTITHIEACDEIIIMWSFDGMMVPADPHELPARAYVMCNDTFGWATADCEEILPEDVDWLLKAHLADKENGPLAWICAKRDEMPFDKWMEKYGKGFPELVEAVRKLKPE